MKTVRIEKPFHLALVSCENRQKTFFNDMSDLRIDKLLFGIMLVYLCWTTPWFFQFPPSWPVSFRICWMRSIMLYCGVHVPNKCKSKERTVWIYRTKPNEKSVELHSFDCFVIGSTITAKLLLWNCFPNSIESTELERFVANNWKSIWCTSKKQLSHWSWTS